MSEERHYYWLKLQETFFEDDTIDYIESQENGERYVLFYLKLCLKALKNEGKLIRYVGEMLMPYDDIGIAKLTKTDVDTVRAAFLLFSKIGLIKVLETGEIYLTQLNELIGSETSAAKRKRMQRLKQKALEEKRDNVTQESHKCHAEIDIEKDIELDTDTNENVQMYTNCTEMLQNCTPEIRDKSIEFKDKNLDTNSADAEFSEKTKSKKSSSSKTEEKAETGKQVKAVLNAYIQNFKELYKQGKVNLETPIIDYKVSTVLIKKLLNTISVEQIIQILANAMNDSWIVGEGYCLNFMLSATQANKLLSRKPVTKSGQSPYRQVYTDEEYRAWSDDPDTMPF